MLRYKTLKLNGVIPPIAIYLEMHRKPLTLFYPFMWVELSRDPSS